MGAQIHFVTALSNPEKIAERIRQVIKNESDVFELANDKWFVVYDGISRDLAEKVGIRDAKNLLGTGIVLPVNGYSGRATRDLWEWLTLKGD